MTISVIDIRDDRSMRSLTGLSISQFETLLETFSVVYQEMRQQAYETERAAGTRQRQPGGGAKGKLPTLADKLLFVLYYYKVYPARLDHAVVLPAGWTSATVSLQDG